MEAILIKSVLKESIAILLVVTLFAYPQQSQAVKYSVCETATSLADVRDVKVSECENTQQACSFVRGFNKSIEVDYVPKQKIDQVKVKVAGKLNALPVPFHVNPEDACGNYGFDCPLEAGKSYKFKLTLPILRTYPKINVDVFLKLIDEKGDMIGCIELPARIQDPLKE